MMSFAKNALIGGAGALLASGCAYSQSTLLNSPEIVYDLSATQELDPEVAHKVGEAVVIIYTFSQRDEGQTSYNLAGTGFSVQADTMPGDVTIYTAGHVLALDGLMKPCEEYRVRKNGLHTIESRAGLFDGDGSMYVNSSNIDIGMLGADDPENTLVSRLELDSNPADIKPGMILYVEIMQLDETENVYRPISFPVLVTGNKSGRLNILSGIGASEYDDILSGMSGAPLVTADGKAVAVLIGSKLKREPKPSFYFDQDKVGRLKIIGQSKDGEEAQDLIADGMDEKGTIHDDHNFGKGFMSGIAQLLTPKLETANATDRTDCDASVPIQSE